MTVDGTPTWSPATTVQDRFAPTPGTAVQFSVVKGTVTAQVDVLYGPYMANTR